MPSAGPGGPRGTCLTCGAPARTPRAFYCDEHYQAPKVAGTSPAPPPSGVTDPPPSPDEAGGATPFTETRPSVPTSTDEKPAGWFARKMFGDKDAPAGDGARGRPGTPRTTERRPAPPKRRVSTADFWGDALSPVSSIVARAGYVPMARAMVWSSPVAGEIIEDATKGTIVDRAIQPVCRNAEKWQDLFDLFGFWAAIGMAQANPAQAPAALNFARGRLVNLLPRIAGNIRKQREKERQAVEALTELMPDIKELFPDAGPDDDPVGLLIQSLFAAPEPANAET